MSAIFAYLAAMLMVMANAEYFNTYKNGEMAPYEVAPTTLGKSYELRFYMPRKWVTTEVRAPNPMYSGNVAFGSLYRYITGANVGAQEIKMTSPVITRIGVDSYGSEAQSYETSFYIPTKFQENTPMPTARNVKIQTIGPMFVYVKTFPGWSTQTKRWQMYNVLKAELKRDGASFDDKVYFSAGYNSPMDMRNRRNEVWIPAIPK